MQLINTEPGVTNYFCQRDRISLDRNLWAWRQVKWNKKWGPRNFGIQLRAREGWLVDQMWSAGRNLMIANLDRGLRLVKIRNGFYLYSIFWSWWPLKVLTFSNNKVKNWTHNPSSVRKLHYLLSWSHWSGTERLKKKNSFLGLFDSHPKPYRYERHLM